jgi:hypothetical protein
MSNTYIYIHVCCINDWKDVFNLLIFKIKDSGLYDVTKEIRCCVLGEYDPSVFTDPKIRIVKSSPHLNLYEKFTLDQLHDDAQSGDFNLLYLHTKGISHTEPRIRANIKDWVNYMCYFDIYQYRRCIELLKIVDCVGVTLHEFPRLHFSGNFWWSTSQYIRKLEKCIVEIHTSTEFWLAEKRLGLYKSLWHTNLNLYGTPYPREIYSGNVYS